MSRGMRITSAQGVPMIVVPTVSGPSAQLGAATLQAGSIKKTHGSATKARSRRCRILNVITPFNTFEPDRRAAIRLALMTSVEVRGVEGMQALVGQEIGPSEWRTVSQQDINTFADLSGDDQWIHVDVERAKAESPFGTTIAHGNLTLSLVDGFRKELISSTGFALGVNYGWNKIRFPAPVPVDARVRGRAEVVSVDEKGGGWYEVVTRFTLEVEGNEKPCFVGDSVTRVMAPAG
jgi:acyl dehydratase